MQQHHITNPLLTLTSFCPVARLQHLAINQELRLGREEGRETQTQHSYSTPVFTNNLLASRASLVFQFDHILHCSVAIIDINSPHLQCTCKEGKRDRGFSLNTYIINVTLKS